MTVEHIAHFLETLAPPPYQESYDNVGLLVGRKNMPLTGILCTLDINQAVLEEAKKKKCNLIVAHHPIIFKGLRRLVGASWQEKVIEQAIKDDIALYAIHTNLDNVVEGVNGQAAKRLLLSDWQPLVPQKGTLSKLEVMLPEAAYEKVRKALVASGAGTIGAYSECNFRCSGTGTFRPKVGARPHIGHSERLEEVAEVRMEVILPSHIEAQVCAALHAAHPYEQPAYFVTKLENVSAEVGAGVYGTLPEALSTADFLGHLQKTFATRCIRHTDCSKKVRKVAFCGGAGRFLIQRAQQLGADAFVSSEIGYHDFFDAPTDLFLCDIGHAESEEHIKVWIQAQLQEKFPNIAIHIVKFSTNPIRYYTSYGE